MSDIAKIKEEFDKKVTEVKALMKNSQQDSDLLSNSIEFRDKNMQFFDSEGVRTSKIDKLKNHPFLGYPYKCRIKIAIQEDKKDQIHCEPHVKAGSGEHLYGICINIDEFSKASSIYYCPNCQ
ncbi:hypothetical protein HNP68_001030 [Borrelia yangtzensis]|uniref:Uncharacterized protein n=1 Tax=Borreliella yangtzensis TaxID=683292 RepID=A0ABR6PAV7_9SPIR|nr:hypothetical protein [Borreliella yangtzensis]